MFRLLCDLSPVCIFLTDAEGHCTYANPRFRSLCGYAPEENSSIEWPLLIHPADREEVFADWSVYAREGREYSRELRSEPAPGLARWVHVRTAPMFSPEGNIVGHSGTAEDISERKERELALRESEIRYRTLIEQASDGIHTYDFEGKIIDANAKLCGMLGYTREELLRLNVENLIPAEDLAAAPIRYEELRAGKTVIRERLLRRKDGSLIPVELSGRMLPNGTLQAIIRDATKRKQSEAAIRFQSHLLDTVEQAVIATDLKGTITYWNRFAEKLYGWSADEVGGRNVIEIIPPQTELKQASEVMARLRAGQSWSGEFRVSRRDGTTFPAFITDTPIYNEEGSLVGIVGISSDITERKRAEEERERLLRSLEVERARLAYLFKQAPAFVAVLRGPDHVFEFVNPQYLRLTGQRDVLGKSVQEALPDIKGQGYFELLDEVFHTGQPHVGSEMCVKIRREPGGHPEERFVDFVYQPMFDVEGAVTGVFVHGVDITERRHGEKLLDAQKQSLEMLVTGAPLAEVLAYLTQVVEQQVEGRAVASILLLDDQGHLHNGASPSLPESYLAAIEGIKADPEVGTCGAAAARAAVVITPDIAAAPTWQKLKHLPLGLGLRAAWSMPIMSRKGRVLGTFGTYFRERREPGPLERQAVEILARTASLAIERKRAEDALRESEEWLRAIFDASRDGILVEDEQRIAYINKSYTHLFGYDDPGELTGKPVSAVIAPEDVERLLEFGARRGRGELPASVYEFKGKRKDGTVLDVEASVSTSVVAGRVYITTMVRDIAERKQAEESLRRAHDELERRVAERTAELANTNESLQAEVRERTRTEEARRLLFQQLVSAQEDERRRISRELHDQLGQHIAAIVLLVNSLKDTPQLGAATNSRLEQLEEVAHQIAREVDTLAWELRPTVLDDLGLHAALGNYVEKWSKRSGVPVDFYSDGLADRRVSPQIETAIYRLAQEALTNIIKHARATYVGFIVVRRDQHVYLIVEDDGCGFDVEALLATPAGERRMGISGMRERAALVGGVFSVESTLGKGTTIYIRIPLTVAANEGNRDE